jgi:hypothetical protein
MGKVKDMLTPWVSVNDSVTLEASTASLPPSEIETTASPASAEEAPPEDVGGMSQGECAGPEGCEIVWD